MNKLAQRFREGYQQCIFTGIHDFCTYFFTTISDSFLRKNVKERLNSECIIIKVFFIKIYKQLAQKHSIPTPKNKKQNKNTNIREHRRVFSIKTPNKRSILCAQHLKPTKFSMHQRAFSLTWQNVDYSIRSSLHAPSNWA